MDKFCLYNNLGLLEERPKNCIYFSANDIINWCAVIEEPPCERQVLASIALLESIQTKLKRIGQYNTYLSQILKIVSTEDRENNKSIPIRIRVPRLIYFVKSNYSTDDLLSTSTITLYVGKLNHNLTTPKEFVSKLGLPNIFSTTWKVCLGSLPKMWDGKFLNGTDCKRICREAISFFWERNFNTDLVEDLETCLDNNVFESLFLNGQILNNPKVFNQPAITMNTKKTFRQMFRTNLSEYSNIGTLVSDNLLSFVEKFTTPNILNIEDYEKQGQNPLYNNIKLINSDNELIFVIDTENVHHIKSGQSAPLHPKIYNKLIKHCYKEDNEIYSIGGLKLVQYKGRYVDSDSGIDIDFENSYMLLSMGKVFKIISLWKDSEYGCDYHVLVASDQTDFKFYRLDTLNKCRLFHGGNLYNLFSKYNHPEINNMDFNQIFLFLQTHHDFSYKVLKTTKNEVTKPWSFSLNNLHNSEELKSNFLYPNTNDQTDLINNVVIDFSEVFVVISENQVEDVIIPDNNPEHGFDKPLPIVVEKHNKTFIFDAPPNGLKKIKAMPDDVAFYKYDVHSNINERSIFENLALNLYYDWVELHISNFITEDSFSGTPINVVINNDENYNLLTYEQKKYKFFSQWVANQRVAYLQTRVFTDCNINNYIDQNGESHPIPNFKLIDLKVGDEVLITEPEWINLYRNNAFNFKDFHRGVGYRIKEIIADTHDIDNIFNPTCHIILELLDGSDTSTVSVDFTHFKDLIKIEHEDNIIVKEFVGYRYRPNINIIPGFDISKTYAAIAVTNEYYADGFVMPHIIFNNAFSVPFDIFQKYFKRIRRSKKLVFVSSSIQSSYYYYLHTFNSYERIYEGDGETDPIVGFQILIYWKRKLPFIQFRRRYLWGFHNITAWQPWNDCIKNMHGLFQIGSPILRSAYQKGEKINELFGK